METQKREHIESQFCWCKPEIVHVADCGALVWVHHEPDSSPPPGVIAEAIAMSEMIEEGE